jgi:8-amino-7-oxononanoate synthase
MEIMFDEELDSLKDSFLYRERSPVDQTCSFPSISREGKVLLNFGSNNYLGLAEKVARDVVDSYKELLTQQSSPLICGYTMSHQQLESELAALKQQESAVLFSSGFLANLSLLTTLFTDKDLIIIDKRCHASIMEVTKYKDLNFRTFPHLNYDYLEKLLKNNGNGYEKVCIVTDSLFSMDGDCADLHRLKQLAERYDTYLVVDEAHANGVYGSRGAGLTVEQGCSSYSKLITTGTLSKAFGSYGGFVTADKNVCELLINKAKPYIYNTALPLIHVQSALVAMIYLKTGTDQKKLLSNIHYMKEKGVVYGWCKSPILPLVIGNNEQTLKVSSFFSDNGIYAPAIRYPTVPKRQSMIRFSLSSSHSREHLDRLLALTQDASKLYGKNLSKVE